MSFRIKSSMNSSENDSKSQAIDKSTFVKSHSQFVSIFLSNNRIDPFNIIFQCFCMHFPYQKVQLPQIKDPIQNNSLSLFLPLSHNSFFKSRISNGPAGVIEQFALSLQNFICIKIQMCQKSISSVHCLHQLPFIKLSGEQTVLSEEDIVAVHLIVEVV